MTGLDRFCYSVTRGLGISLAHQAAPAVSLSDCSAVLLFLLSFLCGLSSYYFVPSLLSFSDTMSIS